MRKPIVLVVALTVAPLALAGDTLPKIPDDLVPETPATRALNPQHVSERTKKVLRHKMERHAKDMDALFRAATLLRYEEAERFATAIVRQPRVASTAGLTPRFFELQEALRDRARATAEAAARRDPEALAAALGEVTATCVSCHHAYAERPAPK